MSIPTKCPFACPCDCHEDGFQNPHEGSKCWGKVLSPEWERGKAIEELQRLATRLMECEDKLQALGEA